MGKKFKNDGKELTELQILQEERENATGESERKKAQKKIDLYFFGEPKIKSGKKKKKKVYIPDDDDWGGYDEDGY